MQPPQRDRQEPDLDFPPVDYATWRRRVEKELGDAPFDSLTHRGPSGLEVEPLYTAEHLPRGFDGTAFAGLLPPREGRGWRIAAEIDPGSIAAAVEAIAAARRHSAELLWLRLDLDAGDGKIDRLAAAADPAVTEVVLDAGPGAAAAAERWIAAAERRGIATAELRGGFGCDPLGALAAGSHLNGSAERALGEMGSLAVRAAAETPGVRSVLVSTRPYRDAGASAVDELASALATGVAYLRQLTAAGLDVDDAAGQLLFAAGAGTDVFLEIAKLRALRQLWAKVVTASGAAGRATMRLHACTSAPGPADRDPWTHLLGATAGTLAAIVGGADSIATTPFDDVGEQNRRLAINLQLIAAEEAHLGRVADPAAGSWTVEALTDRLARAAWSRFQELEAAGGMARCLARGAVAEILGVTA